MGEFIEMTDTQQSVLIGTRPDGMEDRYCGSCGEPYLLPLPYDNCNPEIRDLCIDCLHIEQYRRAAI